MRVHSLLPFLVVSWPAIDAFVVSPSWIRSIQPLDLQGLSRPTSTRRFVTMTPTSSDHDAASQNDENDGDTTASTSSVTVGSSYKSTQQLNQALTQLGYFVGDNQRSLAIGRAAACQKEWEKYRHNKEVPADIKSFNTVLKAWGRCCYSFNERIKREQAAGDTADWLDKTTDVSIYTAQQAAEHVLQLLNEQEEMYKKDETAVRPDVTSYNVCMTSWSKIKGPEGLDHVETLMTRLKERPDLEPSEESYIALIDAYAGSGKQDREAYVVRAFKEMQKSSDPATRPSFRLYNALLRFYCWLGKVGDEPDSGVMSLQSAANQCVDILNRMKETYQVSGDEVDRPDITSYNTVIDALARCGSIHPSTRAENLLTEIKESPYLEPTVQTYTGVVAAWSRSKSPESTKKADLLLKEALDKGLASTGLFTSVIRAWSRSNSPDKAVRSLELLKQMKQLDADGKFDLTPSMSTYLTVIDACTHTRGDAAQQNAALRIAFAVFKSMQLDKNIQLSPVVFSRLLDTVSRLIPPGDERSKVAIALFDKAIAAGLVDESVLSIFQKCADARSAGQVLAPTQDEFGRFKKIPSAWNKHVR